MIGLRTSALAFLVTSLFVLGGCGDLVSGSGGGTGTKSVSTETENANTIDIRTTGLLSTETENAKITRFSGATVDQFLFNVGQINFVPGQNCSGIDENFTSSEFVGPFLADLFNDQLIPQPEPIVLEHGNYCGMDVSIVRTSRNTVHQRVLDEFPDFVGRALLITGTSVNGTPFEIAVDATIFLLLRTDDVFELAGSGQNELYFLGIDETQFDIPIDRGVPSNDGVIRIKKNKNNALYELFLEQFLAASALYLDQNNDGELGRDEDDPQDRIVIGQHLIQRVPPADNAPSAPFLPN